MGSVVIFGRIHGKDCRTAISDKTSASLALPALLSVATAILALKIRAIIPGNCPAPLGVTSGARKVHAGARHRTCRLVVFSERRP